MKTSVSTLIVSIAVSVLMASSAMANPESDPVPGPGLLERATGAASEVTERAAEAVERARGKGAGKGKAEPEAPRPAADPDATVPETAPSSGRGRSGEAERGKRPLEVRPPGAVPVEVVPPAVGEVGKGKAPGSPGKGAREGKGARPAPPEAAEPRPAPTGRMPREEAPRRTDPREGPAPERPAVERRPSEETVQALRDRGRRDRRADAEQALSIESSVEAQGLIQSILGAGLEASVAVEPSARADRAERRRESYRPPAEEAGRTQQDRQRNVSSIVSRFEGRAPATDRTSVRARTEVYRDRSGREFSEAGRSPHYYSGNRRVVRYSSRREIPPVLVAYHHLERVEMVRVEGSPYARGHHAHHHAHIPSSYLGGEAYAVAYRVDPDTAVSRDDILFRVGSTELADAYSYDLIIDIAEAMNSPSLIRESFVIEGHASAEGDYGRNLVLSQERAERIARDLVYYGVDPDRLLPVGYGISEALYPADAPEHLRRLDRRVMVFRMR